MKANLSDAAGLAFDCQPGCGFCCTAAPLVLPHESAGLGALVRNADDGSLRIPISGPACSALGSDRGCTAYSARPSVCHLYPFQVHAGRRIQVSVTLACPGVTMGEGADDGASRAVDLALAQPGAVEMASRARDAFAEYDRRMREWEVYETPEAIRSAFLPNLDNLARPAALPAFFAGIAEGDLTLSRPRAIADVFEAEADVDLADLFAESARDAFEDAQDVLWVEPDYAWAMPRATGGKIEVRRAPRQGATTSVTLDPAALPTEWDPDASAVLAAYLRKLTHRDHTEGAAAWVVDASGYQATPAAAYARVLGESALQVALRAGIAAAESGAETITPELAWRGIRMNETSYHSLPTIGSIL